MTTNMKIVSSKKAKALTGEKKKIAHLEEQLRAAIAEGNRLQNLNNSKDILISNRDTRIEALNEQIKNANLNISGAIGNTHSMFSEIGAIFVELTAFGTDRANPEISIERHYGRIEGAFTAFYNKYAQLLGIQTQNGSN